MPSSDQVILQRTGAVRFTGQAAQLDPAVANIFSPKSIALVGASPTEGTIGRVVLDNLVAGGYGGTIHPVNPKYPGLSPDWASANMSPFVTDIAQLPANIDMAVVMTPAPTVPGIVEQLGKQGVKSVVVISAGMNAAQEAQLKATLAKYGMKMIGPNVVGVANADPAVRMNATFVSGRMTPGRGAVMSQSGAVGIDLIQKSRLAGLGLAQMASIGNQTDLDSAKLLAHWKNDPRVKYILGYLESIKDPAAFRKIATEVSKTKPIILIKSGKSETAKKAASSHTGAMAGSDTGVAALFRQSGVQRVDSIDELFTVAKAFELAPPLPGNRIALLSNSGGYGVMLSDTIETGKTGLKVAQLRPETTKKLQSLLPAQASTSNPVDTIATTPADTPQQFKESLLAMVNDPDVDALVVAVVPLLNLDAKDMGRIIADVQEQTHKPVIGVLSVGEKDLLDVQSTLQQEQKRLPVLYGNLESAITGLKAMEKHRQWASRPVDQTVTFADIDKAAARRIIDAAKAEGRKLLTTTESLHILEAYGIPTASHTLVNAPDRAQLKAQVMAAAAKIGYPSAIKLVSKTITHKTDIGGVAFDLKTPDALEKALDKMLDSLAKAGVTSFQPGEGIMVQASVPSGRETLIGLKEDEQFGNMIAFGLGGIYTNIYEDVNFRLAPLTPADAREMVETIKAHKILKGYRGKPPVDFETLTEVILRFSQLALDFPELVESDINPFFAQPRPDTGGKGGIAVDARFALE